MTTIIANTTIVTGDAGRSVWHDAGIAISEDRIAAVGPTWEVQQGVSRRRGGGRAGQGGFSRPGQLSYSPAGHGRPRNTGGLRLSDPAGLSGVGPLAAEPGGAADAGAAGSAGIHPQRRHLPVGNLVRRGGVRLRPGGHRAAAGFGGKHQRRGRSPGPARRLPLRRGQGRRRAATVRRPGGVLAWPGTGAGQLLPGAPRSGDLLAGPAAPQPGDGGNGTVSAIPSTCPRAVRRSKR